jgi:hypothetical protein
MNPDVPDDLSALWPIWGPSGFASAPSLFSDDVPNVIARDRINPQTIPIHLVRRGRGALLHQYIRRLGLAIWESLHHRKLAFPIEAARVRVRRAAERMAGDGLLIKHRGELDIERARRKRAEQFGSENSGSNRNKCCCGPFAISIAKCTLKPVPEQRCFKLSG